MLKRKTLASSRSAKARAFAYVWFHHQKIYIFARWRGDKQKPKEKNLYLN